jgi:hypothetical protein
MLGDRRPPVVSSDAFLLLERELKLHDLRGQSVLALARLLHLLGLFAVLALQALELSGEVLDMLHRYVRRQVSAVIKMSGTKMKRYTPLTTVNERAWRSRGRMLSGSTSRRLWSASLVCAR